MTTQPLKTEPVAPTEGATFPTLQILIAEDNPVNQKLLVRILKQFGQDPQVVGTGKEAVKALEHRRFDLVFMDVHMPDMDGFEASRTIVNRWKSPERPRIIAVTADALEGDREKALAAGMDDYMTKPVRMEDVRRALERWGPAVLKPSQASPEPRGGGSCDPAIAERLHQLGRETDLAFLGEVIESYLDHSLGLVGKLKDAVAVGDLPSVIYAAHSLRGASLNVGARKLGELCREVETAADQGTILPDIASILEMHARVSDELRATVRSLRTTG